jgi:hypothetical protein
MDSRAQRFPFQARKYPEIADGERDDEGVAEKLSFARATHLLTCGDKAVWRDSVAAKWWARLQTFGEPAPPRTPGVPESPVMAGAGVVSRPATR